MMIGLTGLSKLGLGTGRVASLGSRVGLATFIEMLQLAGDAGVNLIDTADTYGSGDAERLIRKARATCSHPFFVITKAGFPHVALPASLSPLNQVGKKLLQKISPSKNFSAAYLVRKAKASCRRLGLEQLDAFLLHEPTMEDLRASDCWEGLLRIREQGLARFTGVSTNDAPVVEQGLRFKAIQLIQTSYSLNDSNGIFRIGSREQIPVLANQVFSNQDQLRAAYKTDGINGGGDSGTTVTSLHGYILKKVLADPKVTAVLLGTNSIAHLRENLQALRKEDVMLTEQEQAL